MKEFVLMVNGIGEYARFDFSENEWRTTADLSDESQLLTVRARNLASAISKFEKMICSRPRYRDAYGFTDANLHSFSPEELGAARAESAAAKAEDI